MKEFLFIDFHLKVAYVVLQCRIAPVHVNTHLDLMHFLYPKLYSWRGALFHSINILALSFMKWSWYAQEYLRPTSANLKFSGQQSWGWGINIPNNTSYLTNIVANKVVQSSCAMKFLCSLPHLSVPAFNLFIALTHLETLICLHLFISYSCAKNE